MTKNNDKCSVPSKFVSYGSSFDLIGDIAVIKLPMDLDAKKKILAEEVMMVNRHVKTVLNQISPISGEFRLRDFEWVAGEKKTETVYKEYGCSFKVDLSKVYFSPRLSFERMRLAKLIREGEVVVNMFAGVGCFSIVIAKHSDASKVYSIDINPHAVKLMRENIMLNKLGGRVEAILGDAKEVTERLFRNVSHRVLMPLPARAYEYLGSASLSLKSNRGVIHYYDFIYAKKAADAVKIVADKVVNRLIRLGKKCEVAFSRVVRTVGPNWFQVVLDLKTE